MSQNMQILGSALNGGKGAGAGSGAGATTGAQKSLRRFQIFGLVALLLLVGGIGAWAYFATIAGAVIATATVVVESNSKEVQHLEGGIVAKLNVRNGDTVKAGDVLIRLDDTDTKSNLEIINKQLFELLARKARLEAERDQAEDILFPQELTDLSDVAWIERAIGGQQKLFVSRREMLMGQKEQLLARNVQAGEEITGLEAQVASKDTQGEIFREELQGLEKLKEQGLVQVSRVMALQREAARIEGDRGQLIADIARIRTRIGETRLAILQVDQDSATRVLEELREIQPGIGELVERRLAARARLRRIDVIAPRSGFVHELTVNGEGGVIGPGQVIMLIVPQEDRLVLSAQVNPQDIDQIYIGQSVVINFPVFSANETPQFDGEVYRIAADLTQQPDTLPVYAVRIRLKTGEERKLGDQALKPGMPAEAYIQTSTRSAMSYIIKPFTDQLNRAFRE